MGNRERVNHNGELTSYIVNNLNQYTAVGGGRPAWSENGNLRKTGRVEYGYDAQSRLTSANNGSSSMAVSYDATNRAVARTFGGARQYYLYDINWNLLAEYDVKGQLNQRYIHGSAMDELLVKISAVSPVYYHQNALGSTIALTDDAGAVVERVAYDAYGSPSFFTAAGAPRNATAYSNRFLFTGREYFPDAGIYDYRNRVYSPEIGRFLQTDPIRFNARDVNLYRYALNNPALWIDPLGHDVWVENTNAIKGWHQRVCVDTWDDKGCQKTGKYCISFFEKKGKMSGTGVVRVDSDGPDYYSIGEDKRYKTTCETDKKALKEMKFILGWEHEYSILTFTCREFSHAVAEKYAEPQ